MNYGLYLSASGVMTNLYRQDVFANNLSNVETAGFKPDVPAIRQRSPEVVEDRLGFDVSQRLLDRLGGGVLAGPQRINFKPAALEQTDNPLDVALQRPQQFFAVQTADAQGNTAIRLTRDGRFTRNAAGELVTPAGHHVLDQDDQPIVIANETPVQIDSVGRILQDGEMVAQIQVAGIQNMDRLQKLGANLFGFEGNDPRELVEQPMVKPGYLEASAVDPISTLMQLVAATKAATGNAEMIRYHDMLMDRAVNTLGRIA